MLKSSNYNARGSLGCSNMLQLLLKSVTWWLPAGLTAIAFCSLNEVGKAVLSHKVPTEVNNPSSISSVFVGFSVFAYDRSKVFNVSLCFRDVGRPLPCHSSYQPGLLGGAALLVGAKFWESRWSLPLHTVMSVRKTAACLTLLILIARMTWYACCHWSSQKTTHTEPQPTKMSFALSQEQVALSIFFTRRSRLLPLWSEGSKKN